MNIINTAYPPKPAPSLPVVGNPLTGENLSIGSGFSAQSFRAHDFRRQNNSSVMDPLVMVDHYHMSQPTFGAHPHAGMSAVSLLFEDSSGLFHNRDSLGNDFDLRPGDLYWLRAGSGAVHDESPRPNAHIHGLQVFVNVPQARRFDTPSSLLVRGLDMPVIRGSGYRVKVALGASNGVRGANSPSIPMTILDGKIQPDALFTHVCAAARGVWIHAIDGPLAVDAGGVVRRLAAGQAMAVDTGAGTQISISNPASKTAQFALFDGARIAETYVQDGPFVMGTEQEIADIKHAHSAGRLGSI